MEVRKGRVSEEVDERTVKQRVLILGIGNVLMGDEGVGVHLVRYLESRTLPSEVGLLDGGTGSFQLLGPIQEAERVILVDATIDGNPPGTVSRLKPRFSSDYPPSLTAHDIGLKDLLDTAYLSASPPNVTLFAVSIGSLQQIQMELSEPVQQVLPELARRILREARDGRTPDDPSRGVELDPVSTSNSATLRATGR